MFGSLFGSSMKTTMVTPERALRGRPERVYAVPEKHAVLGTPLQGPWPDGTAVLYLAMGCFWGAEKEMWQLPGVVTTAVGYQGGYTEHPTYEEVCSAMTGHTETVLVAYDPTVLATADLLRTFWTLHDPTQGSRSGTATPRRRSHRPRASGRACPCRIGPAGSRPSPASRRSRRPARA
jgi:peptide-methionine (S)-S-oxide reductase